MARAPSMIFIVYFFAAGLRFTQMCIDIHFDEAGDMVFKNFLLMDRSVLCFKLFVIAYHDVHTQGFGVFTLVCLIGLFVHLFTIIIHLHINHSSRARAWISGMTILVSAGVFLLGIKIPKAYGWHSTAVEAILILFLCLEAVLLARNKTNEHGGNENLLRDLLMILVDTLVTVYLFVNYLGKTHSPWNQEKKLHLVGSCMAVLIGVSQISWIAYTHEVFAGGEVAGGGDVEARVVDEFAKVVEEGDNKTPQNLLLVAKTPPVFTGEVEMAAMENGDRGSEDREELAPEEGVDLTVPSPA